MMLPRHRLMVLVMSVTLVACGTPSASPSDPVAPSSTASPASTGRATAPASVTAAPAPTEVPIAADPPPLALEPVASGLSSPISIAATPDGWLLVNERGGRVVAVDPADGETALALDLTDRVLGESERGLLGMVLDPGWPDAGRAFVHYSDRSGDTVVSEFATTSAVPPSFDPGSERILLQLAQPYANHNGGQLAFGPDGHLYVGLGDGGSGGDPHGNGQNPQTLLGTILRLDVSDPGA